MNEKILVVDDEKEIADLLEVYLKNDNYTVYKYYSGIEALKCIEETEIDLAILDIMLPDIDGFRICQKIREKFYFPVIMLTAKIEDGDKIMGLTIGADDYITKPFNPLEVVARVKTQLRRYQKYNNPVQNQPFQKSEYDIRGLIINKDTHKCSLFGKEVSLTPIEFSILWYLCEHQGKVISSEELFENVWKEKYLDNNNTVMAHIGLTPQSVNAFGGFKVQGKTLEAAQQLIEDAKAVEEAGAFAVVLECVPEKLARKVTEAIHIPTIGIGAGAGCDGQILVYADMLSMFSDFSPKFVRSFANVGEIMSQAFKDYDAAVKDSSFPAQEHTFKIDEEVLDKLY
jgi:two-component system response regulator VanR